MTTRKKFKVILQPETRPVHFEGLAAWIDHQNEDPPVCPKCGTDKYVEWDNGEWKCSMCSRVISGGGY